jgi:hypothetical protein
MPYLLLYSVSCDSVLWISIREPPQLVKAKDWSRTENDRGFDASSSRNTRAPRFDKRALIFSRSRFFFSYLNIANCLRTLHTRFALQSGHRVVRNRH